MQNAPRRIGSIVALLGAEFLAVVLLHRMGSAQWLQVDFADLGGWLSSTTAEDALAASMRLVALAIGYYLLITTSLYVLAASSRIPGAVAAVNWITVPALRRTLEKALAVSMVTSSIVGGSAGMAMASNGQSAAAASNRADLISVVAGDSDLPVDDHEFGEDEQAAEQPTVPPSEGLLPGLPSSTAPITEAPKPDKSPDTKPDKPADTKPTTPDTKAPDKTTTTEGAVSGFLPGLPNAAVPSSTSSTMPGMPASSAAPTTAPKAPAKNPAAELPGPNNQTDQDTPATPTPNSPAAPGIPGPTTETAPQAGVAQTTHTVVPGDNLWDISKAHLESNGRGASENEVRNYWLKVLDANRDSLRSGDPDVIYAGEAINLPAL